MASNRSSAWAGSPLASRTQTSSGATGCASWPYMARLDWGDSAPVSGELGFRDSTYTGNRQVTGVRRLHMKYSRVECKPDPCWLFRSEGCSHSTWGCSARQAYLNVLAPGT